MKKRIKVLLWIMTAMVMTMMFSVMISADTTYEAPAQVTGLKQIDAGSGWITVSWDAQINCNYQLEFSVDGVNWTEVGVKAGTDMRADNLSTGKSYYARVRGYRSKYIYAGERTFGPYSAAIEVVTVPGSVSEIVQTNATYNTASFTWKAAEGATQYDVYKKVNGIETFVGSTNTNSITVKGLSREKFDINVKQGRKSAAGYVAKDSYGKSLYSSNINLLPEKPGNIHISNYWDSIKEIQAEWDSCMFADGYQIQVYRGADKKAMSTLKTTGTYVYAKNINTKNFYKIRVRAYTTVNGQLKYGDWSGYTYFAQQPKLKLKYVSVKKLKVSWSKVNSATSYTVYMSTKQKSGYKKVATTKKLSYTITKFKKKALKKNTTYYVYVVANKKVGKKTVKSNAKNCYYLKRY